MNIEETLINLLNVVSSLVKKHKYYVVGESVSVSNDTYLIADIHLHIQDDGGTIHLQSPGVEVLSTVKHTKLVKGEVADFLNIVNKVKSLTRHDSASYFG